MTTETIRKLAEQVLAACKDRGIMLVTAESCTGGLIAGALTDIAGSSAVIERGFVTYSNEAKNEMLGVPLTLFESVGAVSEEVARAMAVGAIQHSNQNSSAQVAVSVTGIAGPGGGSPEKPVGLVHMAVTCDGSTTEHQEHIFPGDRTAVREQTVQAALRLVLSRVRL